MVVQASTEASRWSPTETRTTVDPRPLILLAVTVAIGLLVYAQVLPLWGAALFFFFETVVLFWGILRTRDNARDWNARFGRALLSSPDEAERTLDGLILYRIFMPARAMQTRRALIALGRDEFSQASKLLELAWLKTPMSERGTLLGPLVRAKAGVRAWSDVRVLAQEWVERSLTPDIPEIYLAASLVAVGNEADRRRAVRFVREKNVHLDAQSARVLKELRAELAAELTA